MQTLCAFLQKTLRTMKNGTQKNKVQLKECMMYMTIVCTAVVLTFAIVASLHTPQTIEAYAIAADFEKVQLFEEVKGTSEDTLPAQPEKAELIHDKLATGMQIELTAEVPKAEIINDVIKATTSSVSLIELPKEKKITEKTFQTNSKTSQKKEAKKISESKKKESKNTPKIKISEQDKKVLLRIVEAEATGEDVKGKMLVANVILNRVSDDEFPDSVTDVVFQQEGGKYQFSPIRDGRYWDVTISEDSKEAVERVLNGEDSSQGALYFMARKYADSDNVRWFDSELTWLFKHGVHEFFK